MPLVNRARSLRKRGPQVVDIKALMSETDVAIDVPRFASELRGKDRDELRDQLSQKKREEALQLYLSSLGTRMEKEGKVKINQAEMKNLGQGRG